MVTFALLIALSAGQNRNPIKINMIYDQGNYIKRT